MTIEHPVSQQFPFDVRAALVRASKLPDQRDRLREIERIMAQAKQKYPKLFRE